MIGQRVNNYEIKTLIGEGGMGAVYLAEHPVIGRQAAIKVLHPTFARAADIVARFFNEAKAANAIGHPNIIDVIDVGELPDGMPYLMMEFLKGESMAALLERSGPLAPDLAIELARQAASALGAAHAAGIVHRDLKPANLFLTVDREDPARTRLKVLDFGIAKLAGPLHGKEFKTGTGAILGTPAYMSPEQSLGRTSAIDKRTDIYSLGVILHHALGGEPPFVAEGFGEMMMMHMSTPPPPLRARNPRVSPELEALVMRCLAKKADDRFQSMEELGRALASLGTQRGAWQPENAARTSVIDPALPRTVRLPSGEGPVAGSAGADRGGLSTTLSSSAAQIDGSTVRARQSGYRGKLVVGGLVIAAAAVAAVLLTRPAPPAPVAASPAALPEKPAAPASPPLAAPAPPVAAPATVAHTDEAEPAPAAPAKSPARSTTASRRHASRQKTASAPPEPERAPAPTSAPAAALSPAAPAETAPAGGSNPTPKMKKW